MVNHEYLEQVPGITEEQKIAAMINAVRGLSLLQDEPDVRTVLDELSRQEPNLKVRQAALEAIAHE